MSVLSTYKRKWEQIPGPEGTDTPAPGHRDRSLPSLNKLMTDLCPPSHGGHSLSGGFDMRHNRKYGIIGRRLIRELPEFADLLESEVRIAYLSSGKEKIKNHKIVFAECCKVEERYFWCCKYDFFIVVYEPNVADFTEEQLEILIRHELHHVGIEYTDQGIKYYAAPHDVEEFWAIIREHGIDWSEVDAKRGQSE